MIDQRRLSVVNVRNDGNIAYIIPCLHRLLSIHRSRQKKATSDWGFTSEVIAILNMHKNPYNFNGGRILSSDAVATQKTPDIGNITSTKGKSGLSVVILAVIIVSALLALHPAGIFGIRLYAGVFLLASAIYLLLVRTILRTNVAERTVLFLVVISVVLRASFLFSIPLGSDDIYRYLWDGKVQAAGIDPYRYPPDAPELQSLKSGALPGLVNHPEMKTVYFPYSQYLFRCSHFLSGEAVWGFKLLLLAAEILTIIALWRLTAIMALPRANVLLYALCPLPVIQFAYDGHLDGIGMPLLAFAVLMHMSQRRFGSMLLLGLSMGIKPVALVLVPIFALQEQKLSRRIIMMGVPIVAFGIQFIPYINSPGMFEGLLKFSRHWTFNGVAFELVNAIVADNFPSRMICAGLLLLSLLAVYIIRLRPITRMYLAVLALLLFSPVVHPWYICWLAVFLPMVFRWSGVLYAATASLTVLTIISYQLTGVWQQHPLVLAAEYLPVLILLGTELTRLQKAGEASP
jgi:hypothetical protein